MLMGLLDRVFQKTAEYYYNQGVEFADLDRYEEAVASYDMALSINQNDADAWCSRGILLQYLNQNSDARNSFLMALSINPKHERAQEYSGLKAAEYIAKAIQKMEEVGYTLEEIAKRSGKSVAWARNMKKLLGLNETVSRGVKTNLVSPSIGFAAASYPAEVQTKLVRGVQDEMEELGLKEKGLTPNKASKLLAKVAKKQNIKPKPKGKGKPALSYDTRAVLDVIRTIDSLKAHLLEMLDIPDEDLGSVDFATLEELEQAISLAALPQKKKQELKELARKNGCKFLVNNETKEDEIDICVLLELALLKIRQVN